MAIDWDKVSQERKHTSVPDLAKKYKVTTTTIYNHTSTKKRSASVRPASVTPALSSGRAVTHQNGSGSLFSGELKSLKQKRAVIDRAIQTLESAG